MIDERICGYHCPRWADLPALGLYLDQVMIVLEEALHPIAAEPDKVVITPTIINNYVKLKVLKPTEKKKYHRDQLADLIMLTLFKRVLSTAEMVAVLNVLQTGRTSEEAYDLFCGELELRLAENVRHAAPAAEGDCPPIVQAAVKALAGKICFELLLDEETRRLQQLAEETKKAEEAKKAEGTEARKTEAEAKKAVRRP